MSARVDKISGIVVPARWDDEGNVTGTAIESFDETEYIIERNSSGTSLDDLLHKSVVVNGSISEHLDGSKRIRVISIKQILNKH